PGFGGDAGGQVPLGGGAGDDHVVALGGESTGDGGEPSGRPPLAAVRGARVDDRGAGGGASSRSASSGRAPYQRTSRHHRATSCSGRRGSGPFGWPASGQAKAIRRRGRVARSARTLS